MTNAGKGCKMENIVLNSGAVISPETMRRAVRKCLQSLSAQPRNVLLLPPDFTRSQSFAGKLTQLFYEELTGSAGFGGCRVDIMPALGTHVPMTPAERSIFFGRIPPERFLTHDWRHDVVKIGEIPAETIRNISGGRMSESIEVEINRRIISGEYDAIFSIGQVVPHEVVGMANYSKNLFIGCGGADMINKTHWLGAVCGMENAMGRRDTPVRRVLDLAQSMLRNVPVTFVLTVTETRVARNELTGLFIGNGRDVFLEAAALSERVNIIHMQRPLRQVVVHLDEQEFKTTWLGNKAIYRTRMAIADGGRLVILAPGIRRFGEDMEIDRLIRKYGYCGTESVLRMCKENADLAANRSAAAHLIHGSSESRFSILYAAPHLTREEIESVGFGYMSPEEAEDLYEPKRLRDGFNATPAGEVFYIPNPALGLWAYDNL